MPCLLCQSRHSTHAGALVLVLIHCPRVQSRAFGLFLILPSSPHPLQLPWPCGDPSGLPEMVPHIGVEAPNDLTTTVQGRTHLLFPAPLALDRARVMFVE